MKPKHFKSANNLFSPNVDKEIVITWLKELRSGIPQTNHRLCKLDPSNPSVITGECCLGVLCRIENMEFTVGTSSCGPCRSYSKKYKLNDFYPGELLKSTSGLFSYKRFFRKKDAELTVLNDKAKFTFSEIAEVIQYAWNNQFPNNKIK